MRLRWSLHLPLSYGRNELTDALNFNIKKNVCCKKNEGGGGLALASGAMCMTTWNVFYHYYSLVAQDYIYSRDNSVRFRVVAFNRAQIEDETGSRTQVWSVPEGIPPKLIISMSYSTMAASLLHTLPAEPSQGSRQKVRGLFVRLVLWPR